jgi:hypothetical protein
MKKITYTAFIIALTAVSCTKAKVMPIDPSDLSDTISFSQEILPLMQTSCATSGCHDPGTAADGRDLSNHQGISDNANDALAAMRGEGGFQQMPMGADPLPDSLIHKFEAWIVQGRQNN